MSKAIYALILLFALILLLVALNPAQMKLFAKSVYIAENGTLIIIST